MAININRIVEQQVTGDIDFGDGSLGDVVISSLTETSGDLPYNSLIVQTGQLLIAEVQRKLTVRVKTTCHIQGTGAISAEGRGNSGLAGGDYNAGTVSAGIPGTAVDGVAASGAGGSGGTGLSSAVSGAGANGANRGGRLLDSAGAGVGGAALASSDTPGNNATAIIPLSAALAGRLRDDRASFAGTYLWSASGGSGGSGGGSVGGLVSGGAPGSQTGAGLGHGGNGSNGVAGADGGGGGASGAGGGELDVYVGELLTVDASARISADGGDGGAGGNGGPSFGGGGGGGGGGGAGGKLRLFYRNSDTPGNIDAAHIHADGGAGGLGGLGGTGLAVPGGNGSAGEDGVVVIQQV